MGSFVMEEFVGNGSLKQLIPKLLEQGCHDVPTFKMMKSEDMDAVNMSMPQKNALELRSYLHDRALLQYGDKLEASGKSVKELLTMNVSDLSSQFGIRRGHIARFTDRTISRMLSVSHSRGNEHLSDKSIKMARSTRRVKSNYDESIEQSINDISIKAREPIDLQESSYVRSLPLVGNESPYSAIENILVQKLAPEYKCGQEKLVITKPSNIKASELWRDKPAVLLCMRRPGCIMCRAEAHQLYARKPIFDTLGIQLIAVLHEQIDSEVKDFWPHYWGGAVILDRNKDFFQALGGGKLVRSKFITGFLFNVKAILNYKRAKSMGVEQSFKGEGEIKGGLFVVGKGKRGIACQFVEKNFGDWAPLADVIEVCTQLQTS